MKKSDINIKNIALQAHMGVASEYPENSMSAYRAATEQGYDVIELDLGYTADKKIVALHDDTINRTALCADGTAIDKEIRINNVTYDEVLEYDLGIGVSNKFRGEKIPLFDEVLTLAKSEGIRLKIDNKIQNFSDEMLDALFELLTPYRSCVSITSNNPGFIKNCLKRLPNVSIDYDGEVSAEALERLAALVPRERLTVWLPYECPRTSWVKVPFASEKSAAEVKKYAKLGIWIIDNYKDFYDAAEHFKPDIIETDGVIKPFKNCGIIYDMHTHSENSHDSECPVTDMAKSAKERGLKGFAVTDHCDIEYCETIDLDKVLSGSTADAAAANETSGIEVIKGVEMGEAFWFPDVAARVLDRYKPDVVIGSVHAVKFDGYEMPYSTIDFGKLGRETTEKYFDKYFDDMLVMLKECDFDILAHLTCPLRYINGKYGLNIDAKKYAEKTDKILKEIIKRKIALEINTSCVYKDSGYCEFMPEREIVKRYRELGGYLITVGSDAHISQNSANSFDMAYEMIKEIGFENIYYYKNRRAIQCAVEY